ncbi:hypothetical protein IW140_000615 [Coemansia sp. RSA 1813]|nr:hypothetical protein LPJ74_000183 [Coemansia sp. RSA 1843]KAJ2092525.1 hypothetical protein IW138_000963 [Coemansia sp. RSA 986]KAJ2216780.1 hypothetical protein EV179_001070 [Coemansia sp. RSA 487]KAJ2572852.1 hypothetical protein IW140_000615 [Coemansia sp. RSA 1813]
MLGTADLVDAMVLIQLTTQSDPDYFTSASLVLPSQLGEPNLDALAQLARLLLRYFEQGMGRLLIRDYIPGVDSLISEPFDDLWRLTLLVVSATLLSEQNGASDLYDTLDEATQTMLQIGIGGMWGDSQAHGSNVNATGSVHVAEPGSQETSRYLPQQQQTPPRLAGYDVSNDSFTSDQTSMFQMFQSAHSSIQEQHQRHSQSSRVSPTSSSLQNTRLLLTNSQTQSQRLRSSQAQPALLQILDGEQSVLFEHNTGGSRSSGMDPQELKRSLIGFTRNEDADDDYGTDTDNGSDSDTESYATEFSQDLEEYGQDAVSVGFNGPNAFAAYVFIANALVYIGAGVYLLLATTVPPKKSPYFKDYYDMTVAILQILASSIVSVIISVIWVQLMRYQTRKVVWITTLGVPVVSISTAIWAGIQVSRVPGVEGIVGYRLRNGIVIAVSLILAIRFIWSISQRRVDIERSADIIHISCDVLMQNKDLFAFSFLLLAFYGAFSVASVIFASRITLLTGPVAGSQGLVVDVVESEQNSSVLDMATQLAVRHAWGVAGYLFMSFAWISSVFVQLLRIILSSVVCQWYFHRHEPSEPATLQTLQASTVSALTHQFGTVVLSATFLLVAKVLHLFELVLRWLVGFLRVIPVSLVSFALGRPIYLAEGWNSYTAVYAAFTGKGFFESSRAVTGLLRKHHLLHSPVVSLIKSSVTCYALLLSIVFGYALGVHAVDMRSLHSAMVAVAGSAMPFILLQLVTHVLTCTVEALVVCYAIDLEVDSCHSVNVAEALALA